MIGKSMNNVKRWLTQGNSQPPRAPRVAQPEVVVHYWDGAAPEGRALRDISETGAYILTSERWYEGTIIRIILQGRTAATSGDAPAIPPASICVPGQVVRQGDDGVAMEFVFRNKQERQKLREFLAAMPNQSANAPPAGMKAGTAGQALVEFALIAPLVFLLAVNVLRLRRLPVRVDHCIGRGPRRGGIHDYVERFRGRRHSATSGQVTTLVTNDVTSLLNRSSLVVATCTNNTTSANSCTSLSDPEAPSYTLAAVDVTYTYQPFIPLFSFPALGISATLPSTTIHRKSVMRMLQ